MKTMLSLILTASLAAGAFAQSALDSKPKSASPLASDLLRQRQARDQAAAATPAPSEEEMLGKLLREKGGIGIFGRVLQKVADGLLVDCRQGDYQVELTYFDKVPVAVPYRSVGTATAGTIVLVRDHPKAKELADDDWVRIVAFPVGLFVYQSTGGVGKTIHAYSVRPAK